MQRDTKRSDGHPWDKWFKRKRFKLKRGKDFSCATHSMSVQVRSAARKRGLKVSIFIEEDAMRRPSILDVEIK